MIKENLVIPSQDNLNVSHVVAASVADNIYKTYEYKKISTIRKAFEYHLDVKMWVMCANDKIPVDVKTGYHLKWSDKSKYMTFNDMVKWLDYYNGFGLLTGESNLDIKGNKYAHIICFDFDDVLKDGEVINPKLIKVLDYLNTFVEVSSSGKGLHAFIATTTSDITEFGFNEELFNGKCYTGNRFIKLTGNVFKNYNLPINYLDKLSLISIRNVISKSTPIIHTSTQTNLNYKGKTKSWSDILNNAGIPFFPSDYEGKLRIYRNQEGVITGGKIAIECWKIECPNKVNHTKDRVGDLSAHMAILTRWDDDMSSLTCSHNSCKPERKPNLLKKLWDKIHENKDMDALRRAGLI